MNKPRYSVRVTPNQSLVLEELSQALDTSISMLVRTIIGSWLKENEEHIERIIMKKREEQYAKNQLAGKEEEEHIS